VFDAPNARLLRDETVVVRGNRIESVAPDSAARAPAGARIIDARRQDAVAGAVWDMQRISGHSPGRLHIAAGVTSVRDMANDIDQLRRLAPLMGLGRTIGRAS